MLKIVRSMQELNFSEIAYVYQESNLQYGTRICRNGGETEQLRCGEDYLYESLSRFFLCKENFLAGWAPDGAVRSCLRMERYQDGFLLTCLETALDSRGKGLAKELIQQTISWMDESEPCVVYSHVMMSNKRSLHIHQANGFKIVADYARLLDGTVSNRYYTLKR